MFGPKRQSTKDILVVLLKADPFKAAAYHTSIGGNCP
jgi:hypothetical protein